MAELKIGDRVAHRGKVGTLRDIWNQEEPAPRLGVVAWDTDPTNPVTVPFGELTSAADLPPDPGTPWAADRAELEQARLRIAALEQENATLRAQLAAAGGGNT